MKTFAVLFAIVALASANPVIIQTRPVLPDWSVLPALPEQPQVLPIYPDVPEVPETLPILPPQILPIYPEVPEVPETLPILPPQILPIYPEVPEVPETLPILPPQILPIYPEVPEVPETLPILPPQILPIYPEVEQPEILPIQPEVPVYPEIETEPEIALPEVSSPVVSLIVNVNGQAVSHSKLVDIVLNIAAPAQEGDLQEFVDNEVPINILPILPFVPEITRPSQPEINITPEIGVVPQIPNAGDLSRPIGNIGQTRPVPLPVPEARPIIF